VNDLDAWRLSMIRVYLEKRLAEIKLVDAVIGDSFALGERTGFSQVLGYLEGLMEEEE